MTSRGCAELAKSKPSAKGRGKERLSPHLGAPGRYPAQNPVGRPLRAFGWACKGCGLGRTVWPCVALTLSSVRSPMERSPCLPVENSHQRRYGVMKSSSSGQGPSSRPLNRLSLGFLSRKWSSRNPYITIVHGNLLAWGLAPVSAQYMVEGREIGSGVKTLHWA